MIQFFVLLSCLFIWTGAFADVLNTIDLNLFSPSASIHIPDISCEYLIDNSVNYSILSKSKDHNIFEVSSLKVDQSSATLIFNCQNGEYVYQLKYLNSSPILRNYNSYNYDQRKNSYGYSILFDSNTSWVQSFQLNDNSYHNLFFQLNHTDLDILKGYYNQDVQIKYNGDYIGKSISNNSNLSLNLGNGLGDLGEFNILQASVGAYSYNFSFQKIKYKFDSNSNDVYSLNLPQPLSLQINYIDRSAGPKEYAVQKIAAFNFHKLQSNNIISYNKVVNNHSGETNESTNTEIFNWNDFSNYYYNPFFFTQLAFNLNCQNQNPCHINNLGSSVSYQDQDKSYILGYNPIPNQIFMFYKYFLWKNSNLSLNFNKTYSPFYFLQKFPLLNSASQNSSYEFSSHFVARYVKENWLTTFNIPLYSTISKNNYFASDIQYNSESIGAVCHFQITPANERDWTHITWNFSLGFNYYPSFGLKQGINFSKNHKLKGHVYSNVSTPEENALVTLKFSDGQVRQTKTNQLGEYEFIHVPAFGNFELSAKQNRYSETISFHKDIDAVEQEKDIQIPTYMLVRVIFMLAKQDGTQEELNNIVNQQMEYKVITASLNSIYAQNKIFIKREGKVKFENHPELIPFRYNIQKMSIEELDTYNEKEATIVVLLKEKL